MIMSKKVAQKSANGSTGINFPDIGPLLQILESIGPI